MRVGRPVGFLPERRANRLHGVAAAAEVNAVRLLVDECAEFFHQLLVACGQRRHSNAESWTRMPQRSQMWAARVRRQAPRAFDVSMSQVTIASIVRWEARRVGRPEGHRASTEPSGSPGSLPVRIAGSCGPAEGE